MENLYVSAIVHRLVESDVKDCNLLRWQGSSKVI